MKRMIITILCLLSLSTMSMTLMFGYEIYYKPSHSVLVPYNQTQTTIKERIEIWEDTKKVLERDAWNVDFSGYSKQPGVC